MMSETIPANRFHDALSAANIEYAGLSWGGFNLFGERRSVDEAKRLLHNSDSVLPAVREQLLDAIRLSHEWMQKHDKLLGFIQKRPSVLKELIAETGADGDRT